MYRVFRGKISQNGEIDLPFSTRRLENIQSRQTAGVTRHPPGQEALQQNSRW